MKGVAAALKAIRPRKKSTVQALTRADGLQVLEALRGGSSLNAIGKALGLPSGYGAYVAITHWAIKHCACSPEE